MADLTDADLKFVLSVDPDDDALNKAINSINSEIDSANQEMKKIQLGMDPATLTQRIAMETKLSNARKELQKAEDAERLKQAGGPQGVFSRIRDSMMSGGGASGIMGAIIGGAEGGGAGAALGAAAGGPWAVAYEGTKMLAKTMGALAAIPYQLIAMGLNAINVALQGMAGSLGPIGASLDLIAAGYAKSASIVSKIPIAGDLFSTMWSAQAEAANTVKNILQTIVGMVDKVSPGVVKQFNMAIEDAQATLGQVFVPVVRLMTDVVRDFSKIIANLIPDMNTMNEILEPVRSAWNDLKDVIKEMGPEIRELIKMGLQLMIDQLKDYMARLKGFVEAKNMPSAPLLRLAGMGKLVDMEMSGSRASGRAESWNQEPAMAARPASLTSIQAYQDKFQLEAYSQGTMSVPQNVNNINEQLKVIVNWFQGVTKDWLGQKIDDAAKDDGNVMDDIEQANNISNGDVSGGGVSGWLRGKLGGN